MYLPFLNVNEEFRFLTALNHNHADSCSKINSKFISNKEVGARKDNPTVTLKSQKRFNANLDLFHFEDEIDLKDINLGTDSEPQLVKIGSDLPVAQEKDVIEFL